LEKTLSALSTGTPAQRAGIFGRDTHWHLPERQVILAPDITRPDHLANVQWMWCSRSGSQGPYEWLVTDQDFDLLQICPEVVLGKYVAITSIDSGPFVPTDKEMAAGWESRGGIAYSHEVDSIQNVPRDGWDEWYIFSSPTDLGTSHLGENPFEVPQEHGHVSVLVNYCFALDRPEMKDLATLFWQQMEWIRPESYMADNDYLTFVSMNKILFASVRDTVKALR
jgi:hypothetical protein